jgi:hypothetical protein
VREIENKGFKEAVIHKRMRENEINRYRRVREKEIKRDGREDGNEER